MKQCTRDFLTAWINWVDTGAPEGEPFSRRNSLCLAKYDFCDKQYGYGVEADNYYDIGADLGRMFAEDGLHDTHPFYDMKDEDDSSGYVTDKANKTMHLNERRVAWVRKVLAA